MTSIHIRFVWLTLAIGLGLPMRSEAADTVLPSTPVIDLRTNRALGTLYAGQRGDRTGVVLKADDINGNGHSELLVGVPFTRRGDGRLDMYFDPFISGVTDVVSQTNLNAATAPVRVQILGIDRDDWFGMAAATGDVNGDGLRDLAVSAINVDLPKRPFAGSVYLFLGGNPVLSGATHAVWTANAADVIFRGAGKLDGVGAELAMGDFDGDGLDDLVMSAPYGNTEFDKTFTKRIYIQHGAVLAGQTIGRATPAIVDLLTDFDVIINNVNYREMAALNSSGLLVADFLYGDGVDDLAIGAARARNEKGDVYLLSGKYRASGIYNVQQEADIILLGRDSQEVGASLSAGDYDNNGFLDLAVGSRRGFLNEGRTGTVTILFADKIIAPTETPTILQFNENRPNPFFEEYTISGRRKNEFFGTSLVSGDFNQDGVMDLAVGAPLGRQTTDNSKAFGRVYVFAGRSRDAWGEEFDVQDRADFLLITGQKKDDRLGETLAAGSFDIVGQDRLVVGAHRADGADDRLSASGDIYVFGPVVGESIDPHAVFAPSSIPARALQLWLWSKSWGRSASHAPAGLDLDRSGTIDEGDLKILKHKRLPALKPDASGSVQ